MPATRRDPDEAFYRRRLPHWQPPSAYIFLTWRLHGSLPHEALERLAAERRLLSSRPMSPGETPAERAVRDGKRLLALLDDMLGQAVGGPQWLREEPIARLVVDALFHHDGRLYTLLAFVVMPNHVHVLLQPMKERQESGAGDEGELVDPGQAYVPGYVPLARITQSLKGYTAREANRMLGRSGRPFWQDESYDHWVRDDAELARIVSYIESDPVRAGLVGSPEDWRGSSAWERNWGRLKE